MPLTYGGYLELDRLLDLQHPRSEPAEHDETLFIVIHQVYELWFKQLLHELGLLQRSLEAGDGPVAMATFKRILTIFKVLVAQVDILETMTPVSFLSFRSRIDSASGFQSHQFRELEFVLGHRPAGMLSRLQEGSRERRHLETLAEGNSLWDSFLVFLCHKGFDVPAQDLARPRGEGPVESPRLQELLIRIYHQHPSERDVCERLVDLDEGVQEWRYRHVKMVERTIGTKPGTGGSAGVAYLKKTLFKPLFPDLWAIRADL